MLVEFLPSVLDEIKQDQSYYIHNETLFNMYEGELLPYVEKSLEQQLSRQSFETIKYRLAPINLLKKIIDKLSAIYQQPVIRRVDDFGTDTDSELLSWYEEKYKINEKLNGANEFFNLFKNTLIQPYLSSDQQPRLRSIPSHKFRVFSWASIEPTKPTCIVVFAGKFQDKPYYHAYSDEEILIVDENGKPINELMVRKEMDGTNPIKRLPFVYVNRSQNLLVPKCDVDLLRMTILASILMSDLNYVSMFSAFSVMYGINVKDKGLTYAPNAFWNFAQIDPDAKPELGTLKNQGDIQAMIEMIKFEIHTWLSTRGMKASSVTGDDQSVSGIAKMIDNLDITDERRRQVDTFTNAEEELWDLTFNYLHPYWSKKPGFENKALFSPRANVEVIFSEVSPIYSRAETIERIKMEMDAGLLSQETAMKQANPTWTDDQIAEELERINGERTITVEQPMIEDEESA